MPVACAPNVDHHLAVPETGADWLGGNLVFDDVPEELFNGTKDLTEWGLQQPTMAALAANFELTAVNADDFCAQLTLKAGDK